MMGVDPCADKESVSWKKTADSAGDNVYNEPMKNSLLSTNPHLKDPAKRARTLARNVESSSAIEGIQVKRDSKTGRFDKTSSAVKNSSR
jgi:hypothetical protein